MGRGSSRLGITALPPFAEWKRKVTAEYRRRIGDEVMYGDANLREFHGSGWTPERFVTWVIEKFDLVDLTKMEHPYETVIKRLRESRGMGANESNIDHTYLDKLDREVLVWRQDRLPSFVIHREQCGKNVLEVQKSPHGSLKPGLWYPYTLSYKWLSRENDITSVQGSETQGMSETEMKKAIKKGLFKSYRLF
jgi:hypothetical protein